MTDAPIDLGLSDDDLWQFNEGTHARLYDHLGAHPVDGGTRFAVWAPAAEGVWVVGDFNGWDGHEHRLAPCGESGIWAGVVAGARDGQRYKYAIANGGRTVEKADPFAQRTEEPPATASVIETESLEELLKRGDVAVYEAKGKGGDCVVSK